MLSLYQGLEQGWSTKYLVKTSTTMSSNRQHTAQGVPIDSHTNHSATVRPFQCYYYKKQFTVQLYFLLLLFPSCSFLCVQYSKPSLPGFPSSSLQVRLPALELPLARNPPTSLLNVFLPDIWDSVKFNSSRSLINSLTYDLVLFFHKQLNICFVNLFSLILYKCPKNVNLLLHSL